MEENAYRDGRKNLCIALLASLPGPVALALSLGESATQLADLLRRSCELLSAVLALVLFEVAHRRPADSQERLEAIVRVATGLSMVLSGLVIGWVAVWNFGICRGSVTTSLVFAILGAAVNGKLYLGYRKLRHGMLDIQAGLHRVKLLLDLWMIGVLLLCIVSTGLVRSLADLVGSGSIGIYVLVSGIWMLKKGRKGHEKGQ